MKPLSRIVAGGMLREGTPIQDYRTEYGLYVKREDLSCPPPGPPFSKARGVYVWVKKRPENLIGVLDTRHSQAGHAVARACQLLGKQCVNYYPEFKYEPGPREPQLRAKELGAELAPLPAGRSAILYHTARKLTEARNGVMIPNALKLAESVVETSKETTLGERGFETVLIPISSGTIAAGVIRGLGTAPNYIIHLGYSRSHGEIRKYITDAAGIEARLTLIDEGYEYKDVAEDGPTPPWPCNPYYDLKAFRWWMKEGRKTYGSALLWNIG